MTLKIPKAVPEPGFYYHYKHDPKGPINEMAYEVVGVGFHTEESRSGEEHFLNYRPLYEASVYKQTKEYGLQCFYSRPLEMWMEEIEKDGKKYMRFEKITDPAVIAELQKIRDSMYGV